MLEFLKTYFFGFLPKKYKDNIRIFFYILLFLLLFEVAFKLLLFFLIVALLSRVLKYFYFLSR